MFYLISRIMKLMWDVHVNIGYIGNQKLKRFISPGTVCPISIFLTTQIYYYRNPTPAPVNNPIDGGTITWPQFSYDSMNFMNMGVDSIRNEKEYIQQDMAFWSEYLIWMAGDELGTYCHNYCFITYISSYIPLICCVHGKNKEQDLIL
jgi:hypothetical protein